MGVLTILYVILSPDSAGAGSTIWRGNKVSSSTDKPQIDEKISMRMSTFRSRLIFSHSLSQSPLGLRSWTHHQIVVARHHSSVEPLPPRLQASFQTLLFPMAVLSWDDQYIINLKTSLQAVYKRPMRYGENGVTRTKYELVDCPLPKWSSD